MKKLLILVSILLHSCSNLPVALKNAPEVDIEYAQAAKDYQALRGMPVRWGGVIIAVENQQHLSTAQVLYYPLYHYAKPNVTAQPLGRFLIHSDKFLDPEIYSKGKAITVAGEIQGISEKKIGDKLVKLPVINISASYLWQQTKQYAVRPYYYSPYYGYSSYRYSSFGYPARYSACY